MFPRAAALLLLSLPVWGVSVTDRRWPTIRFDFNASLEPSGAVLPGGVMLSTGRVHRIIQDAPHQIYFGYDVVIEGSSDGRSFQLRAEPLSKPESELKQMGLNPSWTRLSLSNPPVLPQIRVGATVKLDLLLNSSTGQKIVDSISVSERGTPTEAPREFTVRDAELHLERIQVTVNDTPVPTNGAGITGAAVWFYVPGHGRFIATLAQPGTTERFERLGVVSGTRLTITDAGNVYQIDSQRAIASSSGTFFVYVYRDRAWPPGGTERGFMLGSADNAAWIMRMPTAPPSLPRE